MAATPPPNDIDRSGGRRETTALVFSVTATVVAVIALVLVLVLSGDDGDERVSGPVDAAKVDSRPGVVQDDVEPGAAPQQAGALPGSLTVGGEAVLPDRPDALDDFIGQEAEGARLLVRSRSDTGFFVGTGPADRVYVAGEVPEDVQDGVRVGFRGTVQGAPEGGGEVGLEGDDLEAVRTRGAYVQASEITTQG